MNDYGTTEVIAGVHVVATANNNRSIENPNLPLNAPGVWESVFGDSFTTESGESITAEKSFTIAAVWQAVSLISGDVAKLPLTVYRESKSGVRQEQPEHPLSNLVQYQPNTDENAFIFWRRVMVHALVWNNAYIYWDYDQSGQVSELFHLLPDRTIMRNINGKLWCVTEVNGEKKYIPGDKVIHIEGISYDCLTGADFVRSARNSWALALAQEKFASKFFKHGGRVGGILELPIGMPKPARDTLEEGFRKTYEGTDGAFRTVILRDNAKFHAAQTSPTDSQLVEGTEQQVRQIARWFNLSPSKLGLSDSVSYNSKSEDNQAYLDGTLSHWLKPIAMECTSKLLSRNEKRRYWLEHDTSELLRMNPAQRAAFYNQMIQSTVISPNEARRMENMQPYDGGDKFENPNTSKGLKESNPVGSKTGIDNMRVVYQVAYNARHKAKRPKAFIEWIDGGLASHRQYCQENEISETVIDEMLKQFREIAERSNSDNLESEIETYVTKMEERYYENRAA